MHRSDPALQGVPGAAELRRLLLISDDAVDLVWAVRSSVVIDWDQKESVSAAMRSKVRRLLARYDYPPDAEARAIELVIEQAELFANGEVPT